jgi:hypothetical protein
MVRARELRRDAPPNTAAGSGDDGDRFHRLILAVLDILKTNA